MARMKRCFIIIGIILLLSAASLAADVTGKWKGSFEIPGGEVIHITFDLKAAGQSVTGKVMGLPTKPDGIEIKDGKIDAEKLSFFLMTEHDGSPIKIVYSGTVGEGQIQFVMGTDDGSWSTEFLAKPE